MGAGSAAARTASRDRCGPGVRRRLVDVPDVPREPAFVVTLYDWVVTDPFRLPPVVTGPLAILALAAAGAGILGVPGVEGVSLARFLAPVFHETAASSSPSASSIPSAAMPSCGWSPRTPRSRNASPGFARCAPEPPFPPRVRQNVRARLVCEVVTVMLSAVPHGLTID